MYVHTKCDAENFNYDLGPDCVPYPISSMGFTFSILVLSSGLLE